MATKIDTVSSRDRLKPRREPYWHRVSKGCYLGFRKMVSAGHGNWIARAMQDSSGKEHYKALGALPELPDHLRFDAAQKAAQTWFEHLGRGGAAGSATVADACSKYVRHLRATKSERAANDAEARFKNYVLNHAKLAATELPKLIPIKQPDAAARPAVHDGQLRSLTAGRLQAAHLRPDNRRVARHPDDPYAPGQAWEPPRSPACVQALQAACLCRSVPVRATRRPGPRGSAECGGPG